MSRTHSRPFPTIPPAFPAILRHSGPGTIGRGKEGRESKTLPLQPRVFPVPIPIGERSSERQRVASQNPPLDLSATAATNGSVKLFMRKVEQWPPPAKAYWRYLATELAREHGCSPAEADLAAYVKIAMGYVHPLPLLVARRTTKGTWPEWAQTWQRRETWFGGEK